MVAYIYDGSFDGLLTLVYEAYNRKQVPNIIHSHMSRQDNFLYEHIHISSNQESSNKVYEAIKSKISHEALRHIYYAYLSEVTGFEKIIFDYLRLGFKVGSKINQYLCDDRVKKLYELSRRVGKEKHLMLGLTRFMELDKGCLYAKIQPQYNILGLISPHFVKRLRNENWIIHDLDRNLASVFNKEENQWIITGLEKNNIINFGESEDIYQSLWKNYFKNINIQERKNIKLQQKYIPKRYWTNLIEG